MLVEVDKIVDRWLRETSDEDFLGRPCRDGDGKEEGWRVKRLTVTLEHMEDWL